VAMDVKIDTSTIDFKQVGQSIVRLLEFYENRNRETIIVNFANRLGRTFTKHLKERLEALFALLQREARSGEDWWEIWHRQMKSQALLRQVTRADWIVTHAIDTDSEEMMIAEILKPFYESAGEAGAERAVKTLSAFTGRGIIFKGAQSWIRDNAIHFGQKYSQLISEHTNELIRNEIAESIKLGEALPKVMNRIKDKVLGPNETYRAEMVGRTEMARAYNMSRTLQDSAFGIQEFEWIGCDPNCDICSEWLEGGPYRAEEIEYIQNATHPNCTGGPIPIIPEGFIPDETMVAYE
jgi:hypothetical protein